MTAVHSHIYFRHPLKEKQALLHRLFGLVNRQASAWIRDVDELKRIFVELGHTINAEQGAKLAQEFLLELKQGFLEEFVLEQLYFDSGYSVAHCVYGDEGDAITGLIIKFLYALAPDVHAQAWGCGDDEPWEYWFKFENGQLRREDNVPSEDEDEVEDLFNTIYVWWHSEMPATIKEGLLNLTRPG